MSGTHEGNLSVGRTVLDYGISAPGFRLPAETASGAVRLQVSELQRSIAFYRDVVGMRIVTQTPTVAALAATGEERPVVWLHARQGARPVGRRATLGLYHFAILLPDRPALGRFLTHLSSIGIAAGMADHLVSEAVYLTDPDGLGIEVYADRPRTAWRRDGRQLVMSVLPLDVRSVMSAGGSPWDGLPSGSVIGHVHLHVGDLDQASDFYHAALGFDKVVWNYPGALFLSAGGYHHHLGTNVWASGGRAAQDQARLLEWELVVPQEGDASAAARSLAIAGYAVEQVSDGWTTADPWGTSLRIAALREGASRCSGTAG
jgi:catechol 2,3-dioxygenase